MSRQVGIFFLLVGLLCLVIFYTTIHSNQAAWTLGLVCILFIALGIYLIINSYTKPENNERFRSYRRYKSKRDEKKSKKGNPPKS